MKINWRLFLNGCLKAAMFVAFYIAGVLTNSQLSEFTILSQKTQIEYLEQETAIQRLQINELNQKAAQNAESLRKLNNIQSVIEEVKKDVVFLKGLHK